MPYKLYRNCNLCLIFLQYIQERNWKRQLNSRDLTFPRKQLLYKLLIFSVLLTGTKKVDAIKIECSGSGSIYEKIFNIRSLVQYGLAMISVFEQMLHGLFNVRDMVQLINIQRLLWLGQVISMKEVVLGGRIFDTRIR